MLTCVVFVKPPRQPAAPPSPDIHELTRQKEERKSKERAAKEEERRKEKERKEKDKKKLPAGKAAASKPRRVFDFEKASWLILAKINLF